MNFCWEVSDQHVRHACIMLANGSQPQACTHINGPDSFIGVRVIGIPEECWFVKQGFRRWTGGWARRNRTRPMPGSRVGCSPCWCSWRVVRSTVSRSLVMCERHALWGAQPSLRPHPKRDGVGAWSYRAKASCWAHSQSRLPLSGKPCRRRSSNASAMVVSSSQSLPPRSVTRTSCATAAICVALVLHFDLWTPLVFVNSVKMHQN